MGKLYIRVDDRLIHGQTIVAWCPTLKIDEIIAVDDTSAKNPVLKSIMKMSVPKTYKADIVTIEDAKKMLSEKSDSNRLVIVKFPSLLSELKDVIKDCEHIYLGNMAKRDDTNHQMAGATGIFFLSDQDINEISALVNEGFKVTFHQLPNAASKKWEEFTKTL